MLECWCEWKKGAKAILLTLLNEIMFDLFFTMFKKRKCKTGEEKTLQTN